MLAIVKVWKKIENLGIDVKFAANYGLDENAGSGAGGRKNTKTSFRFADTAISQILGFFVIHDWLFL